MKREPPEFAPGVTTLLRRHAGWLRGRVIGLVSHAAAVDEQGCSTAALLHAAPRVKLAALFGPEHGYFGAAPAGALVPRRRHPDWGLPVYSLYGACRQPTAAMLRGLDAVVVDLQDLGARCYTYVATLRLVLEACAARGLTVIVADRPVPLPNVVDGPLLDPAFGSFVASIPAPLAYGLTPGETAHWLQRILRLDLDLRVAPLDGYRRAAGRGAGWPPWIPPSPGIRSWETARTYLATVFAEALPALDYGSGTSLVFQVLGAPWIRSEPLAERLRGELPPGVHALPHPYVSAGGSHAGRLVGGIRLVVTDPDRFRPVATGVALLAAIRDLYGLRRLFGAPGTRPAFLDQLYGTDQVRTGLLAGAAWRTLTAAWAPACQPFLREREAALLYRATP